MFSLLDGLFQYPYQHARWLEDQGKLIERLKKEDDEYLQEQARILETHQQANQCSILMIDIIRDRLEKKLLTSK